MSKHPENDQHHSVIWKKNGMVVWPIWNIHVRLRRCNLSSKEVRRIIEELGGQLDGTANAMEELDQNMASKF